MRAFYLLSKEDPTLTHTSKHLVAWADTQSAIWTKHRPARINSWATDTASVMRSMWGKLGRQPKFRHVFLVPCNSHGLQLLIQNLAELPWFEDVFKKANTVVSYFHKAEKQLAILRRYQIRLLGCTFALSLVGLTR